MKLVELTDKEKLETNGGLLIHLAIALGIYIGYQDAKHEHQK